MPIISGSTIVRGSKGTPVLQDASDALVAVVKGDYAGTLKTWKVDDVGRGIMKLVDPKDVWGTSKIMGLAEHAVRTGSPVIYDRRGDVIFMDDFESPVLKGQIYKSASGGTVTRSMDTAKTNSISLKCITDNVITRYAGIGYGISDFHYDKVGSQFSFASVDSKYHIWCEIKVFTGTQLVYAILQWDPYLYILSYYDSAGVFQTIASDVKYNPDITHWTTIKLVVDLATNEYVRALVSGKEFDLSGIGIKTSAMVTPPVLGCFNVLRSNEAATSKVAYIDNVILTHNEPD